MQGGGVKFARKSEQYCFDVALIQFKGNKIWRRKLLNITVYAMTVSIAG
jgi:hypothetical protein